MPEDNIKKTISVAVLVAGLPPKEIAEKYGGFEYMFRNSLAEALGSIPRHKWHPKISLHIQAFNVMMAEFPDIAQLDDGIWDAVIVTGSPSSATEDNVMWMEVLSKYLMHLVLEHPLVRIIGIGFGHQLVARAFGGKVVHDKERAEFGVTKFKLTEEGTNVLSPFDKDTEWALEQAHTDYVSELPPPVEGDAWENLGHSEKCPVQGFTLRYPTEAPPLPSTVKSSSYVAFDVDDITTGSAGPMPVRSVHVLTLQGHPEFNVPVMLDVLDHLHGSGVINTDEHELFKSKSKEPNRNLDTSKILLAMLGMEPATAEIDPVS